MISSTRLKSLAVAGWVCASVCASASALAESIAVTPAPREISYEWMSLSRWYEMHAEDVAEAEAGESPLVFIGDSITEGWAQAGVAEWDAHFLPRGAVNFGIGGDMTGNLLWRLDQGATGKLNPRAVVLLIGVNNTWITDEPPETIAEGVVAVVDRLEAVFPEADILLQAVFPMAERPNDPQRLVVTAINEHLQSLGQRPRVTWMDIGDVFLEDDGRISTEIMPDFLHLSPEGYRRWSDAVRPWVDERVPKSPHRVH